MKVSVTVSTTQVERTADIEVRTRIFKTFTYTNVITATPVYEHGEVVCLIIDQKYNTACFRDILDFNISEE